jgi:hypothetical protein
MSYAYGDYHSLHRYRPTYKCNLCGSYSKDIEKKGDNCSKCIATKKKASMRNCKTCSLASSDTMKYAGNCGKCYNKMIADRVDHSKKEQCFNCKKDGVHLYVAMFRQKVCLDCFKDKSCFCKDLNLGLESVGQHNNCILDKKCCVCIDERPYQAEGTYTQYVDTVGIVSNASRWHFYCSACRVAYDKVDEALKPIS